MPSYGDLFKQRLLAEAKKAEDKKSKKTAEPAGEDEDEDKSLASVKEQMPAEMKKLLSRFPNRGQKAIVMLMHSLGVPVEAIAKRVVDVRNGTANSAQLYLTDGQFRLWVKRLMAEMQAEASAGVSEGVKESVVQQRLNNPYQKLIYAVLKQLGLPESDERAAAQLIVTGVKDKAKIVQSSSLVRAYLKMISKILGVELPKELAAVTEAAPAAAAMAADEKDGPTWWTDAVMDLMKALGVNPDTHMRKPIAGFYRDIRKTVPTRNRGQIQTLMKRLEGLLGAVSEDVELLDEAKRGRPRKDAGKLSANPPEIKDEDDDTVDVADKEFNKVMRKPKKGEIVAADQGKWIIGKFGSNGMMLKVKGMQVKMEEEEAEKLAAAIGDGKVVSVRASDGTRFIFTPLQRGKMYAVKRAGDVTDFPNGILISNAQLDEILDAISA